MTTRWVNRWRLIPVVEAYARGEQVVPEKQIVYTSIRFLPPNNGLAPIQGGAFALEQGFRKDRFQDAVVVRDFPADDLKSDPTTSNIASLRPSCRRQRWAPWWTPHRARFSTPLLPPMIKMLIQWCFSRRRRSIPGKSTRHVA